MPRVLVVDDSSVIHMMYRHALGRLPDCTVRFARHGKEALDLIEQEGEPSIIFLDINMPVMDGLELLKRLQASGVAARVPVVMVTTESTPDDIERAKSAGAAEYMPKPFRHEQLLAVLRRQLKLA